MPGVAAGGTTIGSDLRLLPLAAQQQPRLIRRALDSTATSLMIASTRLATTPLLQQQQQQQQQQQLHHRRAIATSSAAAAADAPPPPPPPPSERQQAGGAALQHSPLQAFVPQIPFSDDDDDEEHDDSADATDALARRRARRRAELAARGELPRGACRRTNLPLSVKKLDLATKLVRRRPVEDALAQLGAVPRKSARLLRAAVANAAANAVDAGADPARLVVSGVWATKGRSTKRLWPMSKGHSSARETRRAHLNVEVSEAPEGAEFLAAGAARRRSRAAAAAAAAAAAGGAPVLAEEGDAAARDAACGLAAARKRRFESARFVAPAAMARWAAARSGGGGPSGPQVVTQQ
jgi:ribosomal protein L22